MIKYIITTSILLNIIYANDGYPKWFFDIKNIPICVKINSSISTARTIAITKAKAELSKRKQVKISSEVIVKKSSSKNNYNKWKRKLLFAVW